MAKLSECVEVWVDASLTCDRCGQSETVRRTSEAAARERLLRNSGWVATGNGLLCPKCDAEEAAAAWEAVPNG